MRRLEVGVLRLATKAKARHIHGIIIWIVVGLGVVPATVGAAAAPKTDDAARTALDQFRQVAAALVAAGHLSGEALVLIDEVMEKPSRQRLVEIHLQLVEDFVGNRQQHSAWNPELATTLYGTLSGVSALAGRVAPGTGGPTCAEILIANVEYCDFRCGIDPQCNVFCKLGALTLFLICTIECVYNGCPPSADFAQLAGEGTDAPARRPPSVRQLSPS